MPHEHEQACQNHAEGHAARQRDHRWAEVSCNNGSLRRVPRAVDQKGHHRQV